MSRPAAASTGAYGAIPPTLAQPYAEALIRVVRADLGDKIFFTRDDLLHLPVFDHLSTISRYRYLCYAVSYLLNRGDITAVTRYNLTLTNRVRRYNSQNYEETPLHLQCEETVHRIVESTTGTFTLMDIVRSWDDDPHLTQNTKRTVVRVLLKSMAREGLIHMLDITRYRR